MTSNLSFVLSMVVSKSAKKAIKRFFDLKLVFLRLHLGMFTYTKFETTKMGKKTRKIFGCKAFKLVH